MPPLRTPLSSISGNRPRRCEIHPYWRGQIAGKASEGANSYEIVMDLDLTCSTVQYTLQQDELRTNGESLLRTPRSEV